MSTFQRSCTSEHCANPECFKLAEGFVLDTRWRIPERVPACRGCAVVIEGALSPSRAAGSAGSARKPKGRPSKFVKEKAGRKRSAATRSLIREIPAMLDGLGGWTKGPSVARRLGMQPQSVVRVLKMMQDDGTVERRGISKATRWRLVRQPAK